MQQEAQQIEPVLHEGVGDVELLKHVGERVLQAVRAESTTGKHQTLSEVRGKLDGPVQKYAARMADKPGQSPEDRLLAKFRQTEIFEQALSRPTQT